MSDGRDGRDGRDGNGTQRELGELAAGQKALGVSIDVLRAEVREGFTEIREEVQAFAAQTRSEIGGCRAHEENKLANLERLAITNRTVATKAETTAHWAMTIALGSATLFAGWMFLHLTGMIR